MTLMRLLLILTYIRDVVTSYPFGVSLICVNDRLPPAVSIWHQQENTIQAGSKESDTRWKSD